MPNTRIFTWRANETGKRQLVKHHSRKDFKKRSNLNWERESKSTKRQKVSENIHANSYINCHHSLIFNVGVLENLFTLPLGRENAENTESEKDEIEKKKYIVLL